MSAAVRPLRPAELAAVTPPGPRMPARCHDCAFDPAGSPEQESAKWLLILENVDREKPFYCHQGMPMEGDRYVPAVGPDGAPLDARICAGWIAMRAQFISVRRADLEDDMAEARTEAPSVALAVYHISCHSFVQHNAAILAAMLELIGG